MVDDSKSGEVTATMQQINRAWLDGRIEDLAPMLHPAIVMVFPGFSGRATGRDAFVAGFADFCQQATVHEFQEHDHQVDVAGDTAVVNFVYETVYERSGERYRATGRDLWVFAKQDKDWLAVWRTMLDLAETPA